jgi:hypothetical protein
MTLRALCFTLLSTIAISIAASLPAHAQRARVFVASYGNDSNNCSFLTPCRTFQQAVNIVLAGGEVTAIDSAGFGPVTISHAVTITSPPGIEAGIVPPPTGAAISINASSSDIINLSGLTLDGTSTNTYGIAFAAGAELHVVNCVIRNFAGNGISFAPTVSSALMVSNSFITKNALQGILVAPQAANLNLRAVINHVELHSNFRGLYVYDFGLSGGTMDVSAVDTVASNNETDGFAVETSAVSSPVAHVSLVRATAVENGSAGVEAGGPQSTIRLAQSLLTGNGQGWAQNGGSLVMSYGNNFIDANTTDTPTPPAIAMK